VKREGFLSRACLARLVKGEEGVNDFLIAVGNRFEVITSLTVTASPPFMVPRDGAITQASKIVETPDGKKGAFMDPGSMVPLFLVSVMGQIRITPEMEQAQRKAELEPAGSGMPVDIGNGGS
jgi:hypothetical protein